MQRTTPGFTNTATTTYDVNGIPIQTVATASSGTSTTTTTVGSTDKVCK